MKKLIQLLILLTFPFMFFCERSTEPIQSSCECNSENNSMNMIFSYGVGSKNVLDTHECTYTKDMLMDPSITVSLKLAGSELDSVYEKMNEIGFFSYPDTHTTKLLDSDSAPF